MKIHLHAESILTGVIDLEIDEFASIFQVSLVMKAWLENTELTRITVESSNNGFIKTFTKLR